MLKRLFIFAAIILFCRTIVMAQEQETYEQPPFNYSQTTPSDGISALEQKISSGKLNCGASDRDIVRSLLRELHIPTESQVLVFSKTSLQRQRIGPASGFSQETAPESVVVQGIAKRAKKHDFCHRASTVSSIISPPLGGWGLSGFGLRISAFSWLSASLREV